jgi:hypothetical protein
MSHYNGWSKKEVVKNSKTAQSEMSALFIYMFFYIATHFSHPYLTNKKSDTHINKLFFFYRI